MDLSKFLNAIKASGFNITAPAVKAAIAQAILFAEYALPGKSGKEKEDWVVIQLLREFEKYDHLLPVIGQFMDLPIADMVQAHILRLATQQVFKELEKTKLVNAA